jgi:hypothetical protein
MKVDVQIHALTDITQGNIRGIYSVEGCVNPGDSLDACQEQKDDSLVHQPVASSLYRLCKKMHLSFVQQRNVHTAFIIWKSVQ